MNSVLEKLAAAIGEDRIVTDPQTIAPWLTDWRGLYNGRALAMIEPRSTDEVAAIVRVAGETRTPLVPQGGATSMVGGATPDANGTALILSLRRMNAIRRLDTAAGLVVAEAGVILQTLYERAAEDGLRFPLTLGARGSATIGGLVSTNAGGTQVLRFGTMRNLVLGIEAVLPSGEVFDGLAPLKKDNRGYDLTQLLVGAEGTLGVVTAATLKLVPQPAELATAWAGVASPQAALDLLRALERQSGDAIESFELVPDDCLQAVLRHIPGTRLPLASAAPWHVLIDFAGADGGSRLTSLLQSEADRLLDATVAASDTQSAALWRLRDSISEAERAEGPTLAHDISVPVDRMPAFIAAAARDIEGAFPGNRVTAFGHLGDGNVHFHINAPPGADGAVWRAGPGKAMTARVYDLVTDWGGSISAEHGIGQMKLDSLQRLGGGARLHALAAIKAALDPLGIMNPGKLVPPLASARPAP